MEEKKGQQEMDHLEILMILLKSLNFNWNVLFPSIINFKTSEIQCSKHSHLRWSYSRLNQDENLRLFKILW